MFRSATRIYVSIAFWLKLISTSKILLPCIEFISMSAIWVYYGHFAYQIWHIKKGRDML